MSVTLLALILVLCGLVLIIGELFLPTHGVVGLLGLGCFIAAIVVAFFIGQWVGLAALVVGFAAIPAGGWWFAQAWPKSFLGRRMVLSPPTDRPVLPPVKVGEEGVTVSELRPMGMCQFGALRMEASSERGIIPAGQRVRIVGLSRQRPTVRMVS